MARKAPRKKRGYRSELRSAGADETRRVILAAARELLVEKGYGAMRMERIASDAGVALDTVYAAVGTKPTLVRLLIETAISGEDAAIPAEEREYVRRIRAAPSAKMKLGMYAEALRLIHSRLAPLVRALRDAAGEHPDLTALWREISDRRHRNMLRFADDLLATGEIRAEVTRDELADTLWTMGAPELFLLLTEERGWSRERFSAWLATSWYRLLLRERHQPE
jgi:AcrR family transcriptional regulator